MEASMDERLEQAVATLNELIDRIGACGLGQSVFFLEMAKLQLKLELNGVTDEEFGAFCNALENGTLNAETRARPGQPRVRRGGDQRGQGRAWQCANGIAVRRVGRRRVRH
jgi:hypothetical protein